MRSRPLGGVGVVEIDLPEARNASNPLVRDTLPRGVETVASDNAFGGTVTRRGKLGAWLCASPTGGL